MKVAGVQHDIVWESPVETQGHVAPMIAAAAADGARLVVLTEMYASGFSMAAERIAEPVGGRSTQFLVDQAQQHGVWIAGSVAVQPDDEDKPFNRLVLAAPDGATHMYDKIHPFSYSGEHEHFGAGDRSLTVDVEGVRTSFFVCYDLRFADEFWARALDTDLYVVVANWPQSRRSHWQALLPARAIENQAYVVGVNRVGDGNGTPYAGDSVIIDPLGETLAVAAPGEHVIAAEIDPARVQEVRKRYPFLQDRR
ncbi:MAG: nitrilase-related carbon-nitrogen hydrolase [Actinomycetota bacterium]|nr:nitrilase-related carbon-nitrogen hydrolase [Actinomycetota bacterium]